MKKERTIIFCSSNKVNEWQEKKECCICKKDAWSNEKKLLDGLPLIENRVFKKPIIEGRRQYLCSDCAVAIGFMWTEFLKLPRDEANKLLRRKI